MPVPIRYGCVLHTLQLTIADGLKEGSQMIARVVAKATSLVASIHKSCKATELLEIEANRHIPAANTTRWNSVFRMMNTITDIDAKHPELLGRIADAMHSQVKLTATDTAVLNELATLLLSFKQITEKFESECTV